MSKCKEKYGREWSAELVQTTRKYFEDFIPGFFKHIGKNPSCLVIDTTIFKGDEDEKSIMTSFKTSSPDYHGERYVFQDADGGDFIKYYNTVDEIIDDGWAVD